MASFELCVHVLGDLPPSAHIFPITATASDYVGKLKELIYTKKRNRFKYIDADDLVIWKLNNPIPLGKVDTTITILRDLSAVAEKMEPLNETLNYFPTIPERERLHIIVQAPGLPQIGLKRGLSEEGSDVLTPLAKKPRLDRQDITYQLVQKWSQPIPEQALNLRNLWIRLQHRLAEDEKIPISQDQFDMLSKMPFSVESPELELSAEEAKTLFRVSEDERTWGVERLFISAIESPPPAYGTEDDFHSTWQDNIGKILKLILPEGQSIRSNRNTSTALKRPDYGFLVKGHCAFRGVEKGTNSPGDPKREPVERLHKWTYEPLPFILGYHAIATNVNFVAITEPPSKTEYLFNHNLRFKKERVANLVHLIRLAGVVACMGQKLHRRSAPEFVDFELEGGLVRISVDAVVIKQFKHPDAVDRVSKLIEIYDLLKVKRVPNVDTLDQANKAATPPYVQLSPVGYDGLPNSGSESLNSVVCVLEALKAMHSGPNPVYHRDIRDPNIIKRFDGTGWFLIDWSDATTAPTHAAMHLIPSEHSPRVRQDGHGAEVDIWGVGRYLESLASRVSCGIAKPDEVKQMARRWMEDLATSAEAALDEANRDLFVAPAAQSS